MASATPNSHPAASQVVPRVPAPGDFTSWQALYVEQARLDKAAVEIKNAGEKVPDNYTNIAADPTKHMVEVYIKGGKPTPGLAELIARLRHSVPITVESAPYSMRQLHHALQQVVALANQHKTPDIVQLSPDPTGQGLNVATTAHTTAATVNELAAVPVAIHYQTGAARPGGLTTPAASGINHASNTSGWRRWASAFAHYAGAPVGLDGFCTLGAPVRDPLTGAGGYFTDKECGENGQVATSAGGVPIGTTRWLPTITDARSGSAGDLLNLVVATVSDNSAQPVVWDNQINTATTTQPPAAESPDAVQGTDDNIIGNFVRPNGAMSGERGWDRAVQIDSTDNYITNTVTGESQGPFVYALDATGQNATGNGDGGGTIEVGDPFNTKILGVIVMQDLNHIAYCTGYIPDKPWRHCSAGVYYADINDALYVSNLTVKTG